MSPYSIQFTKEAAKDARKLPLRLQQKLREILRHDIALDPFAGKRLVGDLSGFYSARLTYKDRIVYSVEERSRTIFVHRARTHYGD